MMILIPGLSLEDTIEMILIPTKAGGYYDDVDTRFESGGYYYMMILIHYKAGGYCDNIDTRALLLKMGNVQVLHEDQSANTIVDRLAKVTTGIRTMSPAAADQAQVQHRLGAGFDPRNFQACLEKKSCRFNFTFSSAIEFYCFYFLVTYLIIVAERGKNELSENMESEVGASSSKRSRPTFANANALKLSAELLRSFVAEAIQRAATIAEAEGSTKIEATHLERILPQLLLDF
ncbi:hypothetical protein FXO37_20750 [Capsicum annuum]|nr:hypothetical protein FXO37_20750 [Capsicum annuum]